MEKGAKIFIAGSGGLLGSALLRKLNIPGYLIIAPRKSELNLLNRDAVANDFSKIKPDYVFLAAARVGGIEQNINYPLDFLEENILIQRNVMRAAFESGVKKLLFFASNCCYPRECPQPMKEEYLMTGALEPTNRAYAIAKLAGIEMCRSFNKQHGTNFIVAIPASIYGENDHFDEKRSHVISSLIIKFQKAKILGQEKVVLFGDGSPLREFIYADDVAEASILLMDNFQACGDDVCINIGTQIEYSIKELAIMIKEMIGFKGVIEWDTTRPNGMPRKLLDSSRCRSLGWNYKVDFATGLNRIYGAYLRKNNNP